MNNVGARIIACRQRVSTRISEHNALHRPASLHETSTGADVRRTHSLGRHAQPLRHFPFHRLGPGSLQPALGGKCPFHGSRILRLVARHSNAPRVTTCQTSSYNILLEKQYQCAIIMHELAHPLPRPSQWHPSPSPCYRPGN